MEIIRSYRLQISAIIFIVAMTFAASATDRQSSAADFDPDYPVGTPPILGGNGSVIETSTGWHNAQDWSQYNSDYSGYHPGEDWNYGSGTDDAGEPVYAIAAGTVFDTRDALFNDKSGYGSGIAIEHVLPNGEKIYSVYEHIDIVSNLSMGDPVWQGDKVASIADTSKLSPHLHFEIRTKKVDTKDWYPNDNGYGYYASEEKLLADGFTVDPSDFIDSHRSAGESIDAGFVSQVTLILYVHDGRADGPIISGAQVTGQDGSGNRSEKTTNSEGYATLEGDPGTWSFSVSADGYETNSWDQAITETDTKNAFLQKSETKRESSESVAFATEGSENSVDGGLGDLINALKDRDAGIRLNAAEALGKLADNRAVDSLIEVLRNDEDRDVRDMAAWALGQIDDVRIVDPLSYSSVKDTDGYVRDEAYRALQRSTTGGSKVDSRSADPIIGALTDEDQGVRYRAAEALGQLKNATAVDSLIEVLRNDEDRDVRDMAAWALGQIDDVRIVDPLSYSSVKDADGYVRDEAYRALQRSTIGGSKVDSRSPEPIIGALTDEDQGVRYRAAEALGQLKNATAVDSLIEVLRNDEDRDVRDMAAWALGQIDDVRIVDPLSYSSVKDTDSYVRDEAYRALQRSTIGGSKVDSRSADSIIGALTDEDQGVRYRAAEALGQLKNATAVDSLIEVLRNDEDRDVRDMAAWALGEIDDTRAVDPLSYSYGKDADGYVRDEAKRALEKLGVQVE